MQNKYSESTLKSYAFAVNEFYKYSLLYRNINLDTLIHHFEFLEQLSLFQGFIANSLVKQNKNIERKILFIANFLLWVNQRILFARTLDISTREKFERFKYQLELSKQQFYLIPSKTYLLGNVKVNSTLGWNTRWDFVRNVSLSHTVNRYTMIDPIKLGNINEQQADIYLNEEFTFSPKWTLNLGVRYDYFHYLYDNKLSTDTTLNGVGNYKAHNAVISPKLKLSYLAGKDVQLYLFAGKGFHSNDARVVVVQKGQETLPAAYGTDLGVVAKPVKNLLLNAAVWYSYLQKEYVYGGDGGSVEFSGRTRRIGMDFSGRYQPLNFLYLDMDIKYAHGRAIDDPKGSNYIPLAPVWSSTGGVTFILKKGWNGSLRYRYLGDRPANEDYSLTAKGYFVTDFVLNYTTKKFEIGVTINNLLNTKWKETQFDTYFRLKGQQPMEMVLHLRQEQNLRVCCISHICSKNKLILVYYFQILLDGLVEYPNTLSFECFEF